MPRGAAAPAGRAPPSSGAVKVQVLCLQKGRSSSPIPAWLSSIKTDAQKSPKRRLSPRDEELLRLLMLMNPLAHTAPHRHLPPILWASPGCARGDKHRRALLGTGDLGWGWSWGLGLGTRPALLPGTRRGLWCCTGASLASGVLKFKTIFKNLGEMSGMNKKNNAKSGMLLKRFFRNESTRPTDSWKLKLAKANEVKRIFNRSFTKLATCHWANFLSRKRPSFPS